MFVNALFTEIISLLSFVIIIPSVVFSNTISDSLNFFSIISSCVISLKIQWVLISPFILEIFPVKLARNTSLFFFLILICSFRYVLTQFRMQKYETFLIYGIIFVLN